MRLHKFLIRYSVPALVAASILTVTGCLGIGAEDDGLTNAEKQHLADSTANAATGNLSDAFEEFTSGEFKYGESDQSDLREANAQFEAALDLQSDNSRAKVGAAITGVLLAAQSAELSALINQTLEAGSPLDAGGIENAPLMRVAVLQKLAADSLPEIHHIQDAVADTLLPALENSIALLQSVYLDTSFSMVLTINGAAKEIDHAEIGVLLAGFKTLHALSTLVLAYDYDFDDNGSYQYLKMLDTLDRVNYSALSITETNNLNKMTALFSSTSPFLAVRPTWQTRLAAVDNNISDALDILKAALSSIEDETDPQANDLLRHCAGTGIQNECIQPGEYDKGMKAIDSVRKYMGQPYPTSFADTTILVNYAAYFSVQDYKQMLPHYKFYNAALWSESKPVFYFTNPAGTETGNIKTVADLLDSAHANDWTTKMIIDSLKPIIRWQDPTFQGFLPGATEAKVWRLIEIASENWASWTEEEEEECYDYYDCYPYYYDTTYYYDSNFVTIRPDQPPVLLPKKAKASKRSHGLTLSKLFSPRLPLMLIGK